MPGKSRAQQQREAAEVLAVGRGEIKPREAYKHEYCRRAKDCCLVGATNADLARLFRVSETTIDNWIRDKPLFAWAVRLGRERADERVARAMYRRATRATDGAIKLYGPDCPDPRRCRVPLGLWPGGVHSTPCHPLSKASLRLTNLKRPVPLGVGGLYAVGLTVVPKTREGARRA